MPIAFVFPGQGSQAVGMGRDLAAAHAAARAVFEEVDDTLDQKLSRLMFDGPPETLQLTENTQPALMAHSMAALRVMETEGGFRLADRAVLVAGHSLGEYTALAAAGAFGVAQAAQLLRMRGTAMQAAVAVGEGAMAALIGTDLEQALDICAEAAASGPSRGETVEPANDNGGGQVVISGHRAAVERAIEIARARGVKRAMLLPVSAPFHCALMAPAAAVMAEALERSPPLPPGPPVVANVTATREDDPADHRPPAGRAGDGDRALARKRAGDGRDRHRHVRRGRRGPCAGRADPPHPPRGDDPLGGHAGRDRRRAEGAMMFRLDGKAALVTGASGGIGAGIARALHAQGATLILSGTRAEALDALAAELGERAHVCVADLADPAAADTLIAAAEAIAPLDILVNNAGLTRDGLAMRMKDADWDAVIGVDLSAPFRLSRAVLRGMVRRRAGRIVAIGSVVGATGNPGQANYAAAKAGLIGMTKALAAEVGSRGITVNAVAPGFVVTAMTDKLPEPQRERLVAAIPLGRMGQPADIAAAVAFLSSDEAGWITGATLHVNGGMAML